LCQPSAQSVRRHEVDERPDAVDLDHRDQLAITRLELRLAVDPDLLELEPELVPQCDDGLPRLLAEVAAGRPVEANADYG
jgi:hypothetical protein